MREPERRAHEPFERHVERARKANRREESDAHSARNGEAQREREQVDRAAPGSDEAQAAHGEQPTSEPDGFTAPTVDALEDPAAANMPGSAEASATQDASDGAPQRTGVSTHAATNSNESAAPTFTVQSEASLASTLGAAPAASELVAFDGAPAADASASLRGAANASAQQGANSPNSTTAEPVSSESVDGALAELEVEPPAQPSAENAFGSPAGGGESSSAATRETPTSSTTPAQSTPVDARSGDTSNVAKGEAPATSAPPEVDAQRSAEILRQVRLRMSPELRQAVIQLEPRELGRIAIRISVTRGVVRAELRAEQQATLDALERHAPELKAALERVGLGAESFALHLGFDDSAAERGPAGDPSHGSRSRASELAVSEQPMTSAQLRSVATRLAAAGGVDTYA